MEVFVAWRNSEQREYGREARKGDGGGAGGAWMLGARGIEKLTVGPNKSTHNYSSFSDGQKAPPPGIEPGSSA